MSNKKDLAIDIRVIEQKLPHSKSKEAYAQRTKFFNKLDRNRNGCLSMAECQKGIIAELKQYEASIDLNAIVKRSFEAAKNWAGSDPTHADSETVSRQEFRILLRCLHHYLDLKILFDKLDTDDDQRMNLEEFKAALPKLKQFGITVEESKAEIVFNQIDGNDRGADIFFEEFCTWALKRKAEVSNEEDAAVLKELQVQSRIMTDFEKWDINRDGTISRDELAQTFSKLGSKFSGKELDKIMEVADFNKDGKIDYKEFVGWLFAGKTKPSTVSTTFVEAALRERGVDNDRIVDGLITAFDVDEDGDIDGAEFYSMLNHVDEMLQQEDVPDEVPPDCKAFIKLADTKKGPYLEEGNPDLKMLLTSAGIMPGSTQDLKDSYQALKDKTPGNGLLYLVDARCIKLQFCMLNSNPDKHNQNATVAYRREPDEPGGKPVYDKDGKLEMKSQEELNKMGSEGYASVPYNLRHRGGYANGHLASLAGKDETPVYVSYLWYIGEVVNGKPDAKIFVGKGVFRGGKFVGIRTDGKEFEEKDYDLPCDCSNEGDHFFKETSGPEFNELVKSVQSIYATGGIPFIPVLHFQPYFVNEGQKLRTPNPYGKAILDNTKAGNLVYVGMSAGAMSFGWTMGPLTTDPDKFMFADEADGDMEGVDFGPDTELGRFWLFPGLGKYVGIPYDLALKVHVHFSAETCSYGGTAHKAKKVAQVVSGISKKDMYCCLLADYDWDAGQGDALEVSQGKLIYHVGHCDKVDDVPLKLQAGLKDLNYEATTMPRQPPGNSKDGWSFEWNPNDGEVIAAGPKSKKPFHMYATSSGPCSDAPPPYAA